MEEIQLHKEIYWKKKALLDVLNNMTDHIPYHLNDEVNSLKEWPEQSQEVCIFNDKQTCTITKFSKTCESCVDHQH